MLDGIKRALETAPDIKVVGEAMSGEEMLALVPRVRPDVVILDLRMPKGDGLTTLAALRKDYPDLKIIMVERNGETGKEITQTPSEYHLQQYAASQRATRVQQQEQLYRGSTAGGGSPRGCYSIIPLR